MVPLADPPLEKMKKTNMTEQFNVQVFATLEMKRKQQHVSLIIAHVIAPKNTDLRLRNGK